MAEGPFLSASWYRIAGLRPRLAPAAEIGLHRYRGKSWYVVTDPAGGRVHRLPPASLMLLQSMDGTATVGAIWEAAAARLGDDAPSQDQVIQLLGQLHAADLLQADVAPDTRELLDRHDQAEQRRLRQSLLNPLSLRFGLWNPDRFLTRALPAVRPLFGWFGILLWACLIVPALALAGQHWTALSTDVGDRVLAADNLLLLAVVLPATKLLHELGHGFAAKRFGAAVPEIGIMILMLFPMPYVDATAAAGLRSKWQRIAVGGAGMAVELALAAIAMLVWAAVEPGFVRAVAFNVMFAAGITTVLFNGNPLMRYDGYYMLADAIEIPNLGQRGTKYWGYLAERYLLGRTEQPPHAAVLGERVWFLIYTPAALVYRLSVTLGIAFFLAEKYLFAGVLLALWSLATAVVIPLGKMAWHVMSSPSLTQSRTRAIGVTAGGILAGVAALLWVPAPLHTVAEGVVWLPDSAMVRAGTDGFAQALLVPPGTALRAGAAVMQSAEPSLIAQRDQLRGRVTELRAQLQSEQFSKRVDAIVTATELMQTEAELAQAEGRSRRLMARAGADGVLAVASPDDLAGRFLREGELIGYVLPPAGDRVIRAAVPQDDVALMQSRLRTVRVQIAGYPDHVFTSSIVRDVPAGRDTLPSKALGAAGGGGIATDPRDPKGMRSLHRVFQIDIALPADVPGDAFGARAFVRLEHEWEPLGEQIYRRVRQLLLSRLQA